MSFDISLANDGWICLRIISPNAGLCHYVGISGVGFDCFTDIMFKPTDRQIELLARCVRVRTVYYRETYRGNPDVHNSAAYDLANDSLNWPITAAEVDEARDIVFAIEESDNPLMVEASYHLPGMDRARSLMRHLAEKNAQRRVDYCFSMHGGQY